MQKPIFVMIKLMLLDTTPNAFAESIDSVASQGPEGLLGPPPGHGPVVVRASFQLRDIHEIDDEAETFAFIGVLTLSWRDERQAFHPAQAGLHEKVVASCGLPMPFDAKGHDAGFCLPRLDWVA